MSHRTRVYVCHPFAGDPQGNIERVRRIARRLFEQGFYPQAPHLYFPQFVDETRDRRVAMELCKQMLRDSDEMRVYRGRGLTAGMREELEYATQDAHVPVRFVEDEE